MQSMWYRIWLLACYMQTCPMIADHLARARHAVKMPAIARNISAANERKRKGLDQLPYKCTNIPF